MNKSKNRDMNRLTQLPVKSIRRWLAGLVILFVVVPGCARTVQTNTSAGVSISVDEVASGLGVPWGMVFIAPGRILYTDRVGKIGLLDTGTGQVSGVSGAPQVKIGGQGGLLDVAVPPDYASKGWVYFTYSKDQDGEGVTTVARARLSGTRLSDWQDLLVTRSATGTGRHFGSRITFVGDNYLFFGVGDRGHRPNGQDRSTHAGSILRIHRDGSTPADNPFIGQDGVLPEIWSYGHRNPQGLTYDAVTGRLWEIEHGPRGGDEINLIQPGLNYGWPVISYGKEYTSLAAVGEATEKEGMEQPVKYYDPSIAPSSLLVYKGEAFPEWQGNLFAGALKLTHLNRIVLGEKGNAVEEERLLEGMKERFRSLVESPEGYIYFGTDSGKIFRISPAGAEEE